MPDLEVGSLFRPIPRRCELRQTSYHVYRSMATLTMVAALTASCAGRPHPSSPATPAPAAVSAAAPVSLDGVRPLFFPGETVTWEVAFRGIEGGRARLAVGAPALVDGRSVLALHAQAESSGMLAIVKNVHDDIAAWLDADTGLPLRTSSNSNATGKDIHAESVFDQVKRRVAIDYTIGGKKRQQTGRRLPPDTTYDPLGVILVLRGWDAPDGARTGFYTMGGRTLWRTELVVDGREVRTTRLGKLPCVRMTGTSRRLLASSFSPDQKKPPRKFTVWFSDDARRVPVHIVAATELGDLDVDATSYEVAPLATASR